MSNAVSLMYWNDRMQLAQPRSLMLQWEITAAKTVNDMFRSPALVSFDAFASQAVIDNFLGTTSEFALAAFDATSLGANAFGGIINMGGQAREVISMTARVTSGTAGSTSVTGVVKNSANLSNSTLVTEVALGVAGNIGFKFDLTTGGDSITSGIIAVTILWRAK